MKAVAYRHSHPIDHPQALLDVELPEPQALGRDLLVEVKAVSVNPVDIKVRLAAAPAEGESRVLGFDAAGIVKAVGPDVTLFKPGDQVWYAGSRTRQGSNSEFQLVDERIVGHKPATLDFGRAAALPLTGITAWELLFERLQVSRDKGRRGQTLLVVGAAGGVGSILVQLARQLTGLNIVATASRPETTEWVKQQGAHHVIDHSRPLDEEMQRLDLPQPDYVISLNQTEQHWPAIVKLVAPQGKIALIDDPLALNVMPLKPKSVSLHWESMFTRSMFETADMQKQHDLLNDLAQLVDSGVIKTTLAERLGTINAANLKRAHALLEGGRMKGKIVLEGF
ncbi:zinc-binding alcohol dehydrogenase family protein [Rugamonas rubra]|uniref:Zinc-type alcohol dehydrogenase-like protein n=1 Tax=Rugamonas rubra TaxID=758825 RepID=A0A1I4NEY5_9BURK|nr:zinc-binding alcohol dehydrogenase family protein [Rugamonas rubra]SFM13955.1 zinc-binding alcohol dehydrogenase family protein [Rugamonas rubra]